MLIAEDLHTHPAVVAGVPHTQGAYFWFVWARQKRIAETNAQAQLKRAGRR